MSAPEKSPIIREQAIRELTRWASMVIQARCVLCALPAITYWTRMPTKQTLEDILTPNECCLLALYSSSTGGVLYQKLAATSAENLRKGPLQFDSLASFE
jgi:hypothetical protein